MKTVWMSAALGAAVSLALTAPAFAAPDSKASTPSNWKYDTDGKKRIPKGKRVSNADGSWREEIRDRNNCVTIKEKTASGEYKETRHC